jgi:hypothetical protein
MDNSWRHLPVAARPIAAAADAAVTAAQTGDRAALAEAIGRLAALDPAQVGLVLGTTIRVLLEDRHPDGLTGDDVRAVLTRAARSDPEADPKVMLSLLAGALGVHDDEPPEAKPDAVARQAVLLLTDQVAGAPVRTYLDQALTEIERAQLND